MTTEIARLTEADIQQQIFDWLVWHKHLAIRINAGAMVADVDGDNRRFIRFVRWQVLGRLLQMAGVSDILACVNGRFVAIEVKAPGKRANVSALQAEFLEAVTRCGGLALVADKLEDIEQCLLF